MAIVTCTNPHAAGFDPNVGSHEVWEFEMHAQAGHTTSYEGRVLKTGERNYYDDSDFYALVWDDETQSVKYVEYATTRGWTYHNGASVDASEDVVAKAVAWQTKVFFDLMVRAEIDTLHLNDEIVSTTTRGKNKGLTGKIAWMGDGQWGARVAIDVDGQRRFLAADRVEKVVKTVSAERGRELAEEAVYKAERHFGIKQSVLVFA